MLLVFGEFTLPDVCQTVMLIVLGEVETHLFTLCRHAHRYHLVYQPVAEIAHYEGVGNDNSYGKKMVEEHHEALPCAGNKTLLDEDTGKHGAEDTTRAVRREHVKSIVDTALTAPVYCDVADYGYHERDEDALPDGDIARRWRDCHKTDDATHGRSHGRRLATTQAIEENPCHHGCGGCGVGIEERFHGYAIGMERAAGVEAEPA